MKYTKKAKLQEDRFALQFRSEIKKKEGGAKQGREVLHRKK